MHEDPGQKAATRSWIWCRSGSAIINLKIEGKADGTAMTRSARECLQLLVLLRKERLENSFEATLENEIIL